MDQEIFNSTNFIMPHQFEQNKFVQEFVIIIKLSNNLHARYFFVKEQDICLIYNFFYFINYLIYSELKEETVSYEFDRKFWKSKSHRSNPTTSRNRSCMY